MESYNLTLDAPKIPVGGPTYPVYPIHKFQSDKVEDRVRLDESVSYELNRAAGELQCFKAHAARVELHEKEVPRVLSEYDSVEKILDIALTDLAAYYCDCHFCYDLIRRHTGDWRFVDVVFGEEGKAWAVTLQEVNWPRSKPAGIEITCCPDLSDRILCLLSGIFGRDEKIGQLKSDTLFGVPCLTIVGDDDLPSQHPRHYDYATRKMSPWEASLSRKELTAVYGKVKARQLKYSTEQIGGNSPYYHVQIVRRLQLISQSLHSEELVELVHAKNFESAVHSEAISTFLAFCDRTITNPNDERLVRARRNLEINEVNLFRSKRESGSAIAASVPDKRKRGCDGATYVCAVILAQFNQDHKFGNISKSDLNDIVRCAKMPRIH